VCQRVAGTRRDEAGSKNAAPPVDHESLAS
jgi:hypothetical protein